MGKAIKKVGCGVWCFLLSLGYARAASALSREGRFEEAKRLMMADRKDCC